MKPHARTPRKRKIPTVQSLTNAALDYLGKYAASEANLRRVLQNRIRRAAFDNPGFAEDQAAQALLSEAIENIVATHKRTGILDDAAFASLKTGSLRRQGVSARRIEEKLRLKGISSALTVAALEEADEGDKDSAEKKAALLIAKKKRLGPYAKNRGEHATPEEKRAQKQKAFATLARAGFSGATIREVLGVALEELPEEDFF